MFLKLVRVAILATAVGPVALEAQTIGQIGRPAETPSASFKGGQYVDSRGCVFMRIVTGGKVGWYPRVNRDRKVVCGLPPTFGPKPVIEMAEAAPAPKPAPVAKAPVAKAPVAKAPRVVVATAEPPPSSYVPAPVAPVRTQVPRAVAPRSVAVAPVLAPVAVATQPAPYVQTAPKGTYEVAASAGVAGKIGCYSSAPVAERVKLTSGGTAVVCTRGDGTMTGWRPPIYPRSAGVGASLSDPPMMVARADHNTASGGYVAAEPRSYARAPEATIPTPPKGYKMAWADDRLNPNRARGTAQGWADQNQIWTQEVPARLVTDAPKAKKKKVVMVDQSGNRITVSSKNSASAAAPVAKATGRSYVQVGTFGVASNADGAASRLKAIGLPVARSKITSGGKPMQIVLAGPFASAAEARDALSAARGAGFGDAILR